MTKQEATAGANCVIEQFLKDLWHPIKEKPKKRESFYIKLQIMHLV